MLLALEEADFSAFGTSGARGDIADPWERFSADRKSTILANNAESDVRALQEAYDRRIDDISRVTGIRLENPALNRRLTRVHGRQEFVGGLGFAQFQKHLKNQLDFDGFDAELKRLAEQFPDHASIIQPHLSPREQARRIAADAEREALDLASRDKSWMGAALGFAGGFAGSLEDPLMAMTMTLGDPGGGRSLLTHALRAAAINAGAETVLQPFVQAWRAEAGLPHGLSHAATNIAMSAAFGAGIDVIGRSAYRGFRVYRGGEWIETPDAATSLDEAALRLPKRNPIRQAYEGDGKPLAEALEKSDDASMRDLAQRAQDDGLFERYGIVDEWSHRDNLAQAMRRAEAPDLEPPPGRAAPEPPAAWTPDLTDEAPVPARRFEIEGRPVAFKQLSARNIGVDPQTFQFKGGADAAGATARMSGVGEWDDLAAGKVFVYERADGSRVIADGHQRLSLAKRLIADGRSAPKLDAYVFREADGWEPGDVRALAAKKNLQEGSGTVLDAAKVMRERPDIVDGSMPMSSAMMRTARSLSRLEDDAFDAVIGGVVPANHASLVAELVPDRARHLATIEELSRLQPENIDQARIAIGQINAAPSRVDVQMSLLGAETVTRSLMAERMRVLDAALKHLSADARVFSTLNREAARIESAGNRLAPDANARLADEAGQTRELIASLALSSGRVSDLLNEAAEAVSNGASARMAGEAFARRVSDVLERDGLSGLTSEAVVAQRPLDLFDDPGGEDAARQLETMEASREARDAEVDGERDLFFALRDIGPPALPAGALSPVDDLGFYSKAVRAAKAIKQTKGTPEQMLAQLRRAGVKQAEIEATGLDEFLDGQKSVNRDGIVAFLELQQVPVREARYYSGEISIDDATDEMLDKRAKWSSYSLDPSNPTYRETVLHLPSRDPNWMSRTDVEARQREIERLSENAGFDVADGIIDPRFQDEWDRLEAMGWSRESEFDFRNGHFSEPNAISHLRTSMQPDAEGKQNFVINELQSDWGQNIRDSGGARDEAKERQIKAAADEALRKFRNVINDVADRARRDGNSEANVGDFLKGTRDLDNSDSRRLESLFSFHGYDVYLKPDEVRAMNDADLRHAEWLTVDAGVFGHPLVNTTDQWVNTSLRRALRQAVEDGADYIAIASGETVDSFNMGAPVDGLKYAYNEMYPKKLRDIIKKIDKDAAKPESYRSIRMSDGKAIPNQSVIEEDGAGNWLVATARNGRKVDVREFETREAAETFAGPGFTRFPITDKIRQKVLGEGQPLFAVRELDPEANRFTARAAADMANLRKDIDKVIARLPNEIRLDLQDRLVYRSQEIDGYFDATENLIRVALAAENPARIARHEEIHVYRQLGLLSDPEWGALVDYARANGLREKYNIDTRYRDIYSAKYKGDQGRLEQVLDEEMVAEMWADYASGVRFGGAIDRIIAKVIDVLRRIAATLRVRGYTSVSDVFQRIESGEVGARRPRPGETQPTNIDEIGLFDRHPGPVRAYHGTLKEFDQFDTRASHHFGVHFGTSGQAFDIVKPGVHSLPRKFRSDALDGSRIIPVVLNTHNPIELPDLQVWRPTNLVKELKSRGVEFTDVELSKIARMQAQQSNKVAYDIIGNRLTASGFDSVRYRNAAEGLGWSYIVWESGKVHSALDPDRRWFSVRNEITAADADRAAGEVVGACTL